MRFTGGPLIDLAQFFFLAMAFFPGCIDGGSPEDSTEGSDPGTEDSSGGERDAQQWPDGAPEEITADAPESRGDEGGGDGAGDDDRPEGPDGSCVPGDFGFSQTEYGRALQLKFFGDRIALIEVVSRFPSLVDLAWTTFRLYGLDGMQISGIPISDTAASASVWTGSEFGIFIGDTRLASTPGELVLVDQEGNILQRAALSGSHVRVAWTGDAFASLRVEEENNFYWTITRIDRDGTEEDTGRFYLVTDTVYGFEWTGANFLIAYRHEDEADAGKFWYHAAPYDWSGTALSSPGVIDDEGIADGGRLYTTPWGMAALWTDSRESYPIRYAVHLRLMDDLGRPTGPAVDIADANGITRVNGWVPAVWLDAAWTEERSIIAYTNGGWPEDHLILRSLLPSGVLGPPSVVFTNHDFEAYENTYPVAAEGANVAFSYSYFCEYDAPYCLELRIGLCLDGE